ncbi:FAR1 DNA-binding domain [Sesbania bispinosa]|nr:FAR1 DNA-binding domain [Sesbania bispinosa]
MDVQVINVEEGSGHEDKADDGDAEPSDGEINNAENPGSHVEDGISEPYVGMEFDSEEVAKTFYDEYARRMGFSSKIGPRNRSKADGSNMYREFVCGKEGLKKKFNDTCDAMIRIELKSQNKWVVTKFVKEHSHSLVSSNKANNLRPRKHFSSVGRTMPETYQGVGLVPSGVMHVLTVFTVTNVLTLPSHYILKRWTRNAKGSAGLDERGGESHGQESLSSRYSSLCREAIRYAEEGAVSVETYNAAMSGLREGGKKVSALKRSVAKVTPPNNQVSGTAYDDRKTTTSTLDTTPLLWPRQDELTRRFNLNDAGGTVQSVADLNLPRMAPVSLHRDDSPSENMVVLPCLKSMTWVMENKNSSPGNRVAVINLKLQDYSRTPSTESEVKFQLSRVSLEPMLKSMAYISEQLSTPANKVAVINLKLQDTETTTGESEVKFQVSRDTLGAMLRSMAYIREQLSSAVTGDAQSEPLLKKHRKDSARIVAYVNVAYHELMRSDVQGGPQPQVGGRASPSRWPSISRTWLSPE